MACTVTRPLGVRACLGSVTNIFRVARKHSFMVYRFRTNVAHRHPFLLIDCVSPFLMLFLLRAGIRMMQTIWTRTSTTATCSTSRETREGSKQCRSMATSTGRWPFSLKHCGSLGVKTRSSLKGPALPSSVLATQGPLPWSLRSTRTPQIMTP